MENLGWTNPEGLLLESVREENARLKSENERLRGLARDILENDPNEHITGGHTVLDAWRHSARAALGEPE